MASAGKVLMLVENLSVPFDRRVWQEALTLKSGGFEVSVVCPRMVDRKPFEILEGVTVYRYPMPYTANRAVGYLLEYSWMLFFSFIYALWVYFQRGFHVIHACNPPDLLFLVALPFRPLGVKFVFDQHDLGPETFESKFGRRDGILLRTLFLLEKWTYSLAHAVISTNGSYRQVALERGRVPPERVWIVRSAPDLKRFAPVEPAPELKRGKRFLVCYLGTMGQQDGVDYLLRSVKTIYHDWQRRDIQFALMGGGENLPVLQAMAQEFRLEETCHFTGRIPDDLLRQYLSTADLAVAPDPVNPLNNVSTMNKILEYMAMSLPIVSYRLVESERSAGEAALYARDNDEEDFAHKIISLLDDPDSRHRMGAYGRKRFEEELTWDRSAEQLFAAYRSLKLTA